ncbi:MAG TPA: aminomethyl-transferring glycine dehydrogenase subunit GcvPA [candidate division Zixibacteria bacterium]|nr:aminomethyl-transferring glycine dehydrogenase subunit GcvPA [candidate division Zixibacteria bacterium]
MRYTPHTADDKRRMLREIGLDSVEELFEQVPRSLRERARIRLPDGLSEPAVLRRLASLAARNGAASGWSFFLGGGSYHHAIPGAVDAIVSRSEFATSYTPYQPEVSQGTLQALFEFQTLVCQLTGMEAANAGVYDGASAAAEAVLMSRRVQPAGRRRVLVSRALHPQYRQVIATYLANLEGLRLEEVGYDASGVTDVAQLADRLGDDALCAVVGYPNFFGAVENLEPLRAACERAGAQLISVTTEPLALGLLKPPGEFGVPIAVGEGQSLGVPMAFGGPGFGFFATQKKFIRSLPGRLVGETVDVEGRRGFVLTLATREQHIRREKATSNICTSQTLCALAATVYLSLLGRSGLRRLAEINLSRAHRAEALLAARAGLRRRFSAPFFNEFVVQSRDPEALMRRCAEHKIVPGIPLGRWYPELADAVLVCVTEMNEGEEIEKLATIAAA